MMPLNPTNNGFDLNRFVDAQATLFDDAVDELRAGRKHSHWMWFIFPQIAGLGHSPMAIRYAIRNTQEAKAYLEHEVLGERLRLCAQLVLSHNGLSAHEIFGSPDDLKLRSSMTLFMMASLKEEPFADVLDIFFDGRADEKTVSILQQVKG